MSEVNSNWQDPVQLCAVSPQYDEGFRDGVSESKRLNAEDFDAQRLRADTAEAELRTERLRADAAVGDANEAERKLAAAEQRIASIVGKPAKCKECGSDALFWFDSSTNTSGVMEGRLRTNEVTCTFVLGCADCSATIKTVRADTIAARMTAALNPNPEAESHG